MARVLTDGEIEALLNEAKALPAGWRNRLRLRPKANSKFAQQDLEIPRDAGGRFRLVLKTSLINPLDFSVILLLEEDGGDYRLTRYNGLHPSQHTNQWERRRGDRNSTFGPAFHIHRATERYQLEGLDIDGFAEVTDKYADFESALSCFVQECGFRPPADEPSPQLSLFEQDANGT